MKKTVYVVKIGGKLFLEKSSYGLFNQSTTSDILHAKFYETVEMAEKAKKKSLNSEVIEITITDEVSSNEDRLKETIEILEQQNEALKKVIANYKEILGENNV